MNTHNNSYPDGKGSITLSSSEIAQLTGGTWEGLGSETAFSGASVGEAQGAAGEIYFALSKEHWAPSRLATLQAEGVIAAAVPRHAQIASAPVALLRVDDPREALRIVAQENARRAKARRILVTGTEGKTGLKFMLHHIMSRQLPCHAVLNSANLHVPIWRSMASIHREDEYAIIEVSVAQPNRGWQRSKIIRPHLCVITNISPQHTIYHGTMDRLIRHKAESVTSLLPGGVCFINADNDYYLDLKDAIQRIRSIPVLSFGSSPWCEGYLLSSNFALHKGGWQVQARIFGRSVNYFVSMVNSYAPLASVSALTIAAYLGLDMDQACASLGDYSPFETAGRIVNLPVAGGEFTLFDHSLRGSLAGFRSAFDDLERIAGKRRVRMVLGAIRDLGEHEREPVHRQLAALINPERVEKIYTAGDEMRIVREAYSEPSQLGPHGDTWEEITEELFGDIRPGDVVIVKGHHRVWLSLLVEAMENRFRTEQGTPTAASPAAEASPLLAQQTMRTLIAGGDVMLSRDVPGLLASAGVDSAFREIRPLLERADIALANLECVISGKGDFFDKGEGRPYYYRCPPNSVNTLVASGFSILTTANNHAMDFGPEALADQARILAEAGLASAGSGPDAESAAQPIFLKAGGLVVAVVSFATDLPLQAADVERCGIFHVSLDREAVSRLRPVIETARQGADLIIASPHWGENWSQHPSEDIRRLAWALVDLGVDAVLGHSAHIPQGIEVYRGRPIVYDMGSLLFDRVQQDRMRHSALFELTFGDQGIERLRIYPVELEPGAVRPASDAEGSETLQLIEELSRKLDPAVEFHNDGQALELRLPPLGLAKHKSCPGTIFDRNTIHHVEPDNPALGKTNVFYSAPPENLDPGCRIDLGGGLEVLGARFPEQARAGAGFALEVYFRYPETEGRRWRASLLGINPLSGEEFRYRHPVAEGMWVSQNWHDASIICDRVVVRPPSDLAAARYDLYWNLVDADTGKLRKIDSNDPRVRDNWLRLGSIHLVADGSRMVAWIPPAATTNIPALTQSKSVTNNEGDTSPPPHWQAETDAMAGLRRLSLDDLPRYKAALAESRRTTWQHYFPFLYLFSITAKTEHIWIAEEGGSLCLYRRNLTANGPRLYLASLPLPMNMAVLKNCLERVRQHNRSQDASIYWVDEEDLTVLKGLGDITMTPYNPDYLYDPKAYHSLTGGEMTRLRRNLAHLHKWNDVELRAYTQNDLADCLALLDEWTELQKDKHEKILYQRYTQDCLKLADQFAPEDLFGRVALINGKIRSFGFGGEMYPGLGNFFIAYSDHHIKGLNYFMVTQLMLTMQDHGLVNGGIANTPGLKYAKETLCPVGMHNSYRVKIGPAAKIFQADAPDCPPNTRTQIASTGKPVHIGQHKSDPERQASPQGNTLIGLRRLSMEDLSRYKAALEQSGGMSWPQYFPFLYLYEATAKTEEFLIGEESGSLCIYRRNLTAKGPMLYLAFLPMPMNMAVLESCLARIREHNNSPDAMIYWVGEEELASISSLRNTKATPLHQEYIYAPENFRSLRGNKKSNFRKNVSLIQMRDDVEWRPYKTDDLAECLMLMDEWAELQKEKHEKVLYQRYSHNCLKFAHHFESRDLFGQVFLVGEKIRAFGFGGEMRPGIANVFVGYADHRITGLHQFMYYQLLLAMDGYELANAGHADTPGIQFAKDHMRPVSMHGIYRVSASAGSLTGNIPEALPENGSIPEKFGNELSGKLEKTTGSIDTSIYIAAAKELNLSIEIIRQTAPSLCRISNGQKHLLIEANALSLTSTVHRRMAYDKFLTLERLEQAGVPCPKAKLFRVGKEQEILQYAATNRPVVVKPKTGSFGRGVCVNPQDDKSALEAVREIRKMKRDFVQVESFIEGYDYRVMLYDAEVIGITKWIPPHVIGDGTRTLKELIEARSAYRKYYTLSEIVVDEEEIMRQGFDYASVLPEGVSCGLNRNSSYLVGGETTRIDPALIHPDNLEACRCAADATYINFSGIDLISKDISVSYRENGAAINEINTCPNIFVHYFADMGEDAREARRILQKYFGL